MHLFCTSYAAILWFQNLYLLLNNSSVKHVILEEVPKTNELKSLKLSKAALARWLSHWKASQRAVLAAPLEAMYEQKSELAIHCLRDDLANHKITITLYFFLDVQRLQMSWELLYKEWSLIFFKRFNAIFTLIQPLQKNSEHPEEPKRSYSGRLQDILILQDIC